MFYFTRNRFLTSRYCGGKPEQKRCWCTNFRRGRCFTMHNEWVQRFSFIVQFLHLRTMRVLIETFIVHKDWETVWRSIKKFCHVFRMRAYSKPRWCSGWKPNGYKLQRRTHRDYNPAILLLFAVTTARQKVQKAVVVYNASGIAGKVGHGCMSSHRSWKLAILSPASVPQTPSFVLRSKFLATPMYKAVFVEGREKGGYGWGSVILTDTSSSSSSSYFIYESTVTHYCQ